MHHTILSGTPDGDPLNGTVRTWTAFYYTHAITYLGAPLGPCTVSSCLCGIGTPGQMGPYLDPSDEIHTPGLDPMGSQMGPQMGPLRTGWLVAGLRSTTHTALRTLVPLWDPVP